MNRRLLRYSIIGELYITAEEKWMRKSIISRAFAFVLAVSVSVIGIIPGIGEVVYAQNSTVGIDGKQYELEEKSKYVYSGVTPSTITSSGSQFGVFSITGDLTSIDAVDGYASYEVTNGMATLSYSPTGAVVNAGDTDWHIFEDKTDDVNGEKLHEKIKKGTVILQTSNDGNNWITDLIKTNIADTGSGYSTNFYETKDIQLINGCYYRVIVAYEVERRLPDKQVWIASFENNEYKKYVEVYEFYLRDDTDAIISKGAHSNTMKVVGDQTNVTNTGKDNGFSGQNAITIKDPHYGWDIGEFTLHGYTNTADYQGEEYFLKNCGDAITLTFTLEQDINCLNGNTSLSIASDKNGSDQYFQVTQTDFKHGTLIIRHTDFQGNKSKPIIYTDFLAAYARTGADTRVQFFEEGDYEVALDYEIKNSTGIDSYTNYRMFFKFKIRNGNNMVYAFDKETGSQLADKAWSESGFKIDTANSHYLTVTVEKYAIVDSDEGKKRDLSWSRTASDGDSYTEGGIYVVSVSNRYQPNGDVSKTFYVGIDPYVRAIYRTGKPLDQIVELIRYTNYEMQDYLNAMSKEHKSLDEIVTLVNQGYEIGNSGELIAPPEPEQEERHETAETEVEEAGTTDKTVETVEMHSGETAEEETAEDEEKKKTNPAPIIVLLAVGASAAGVFAINKNRKQKHTSDGANSDTSGEKGERHNEN